MNKGRPKSKDFTPEEFENLSREERQLRGKISTLKRMMKRREEKMEELMKPVHKLQEEINTIKTELEELKMSIKDMGFNFPTFRVESFNTKDKPYWRGVWYVNGKKKQKYLGSEEKVFSLVGSKVRGFSELLSKQREDKIYEYFLPELQLEFWKKQYEDFVSDKNENSPQKEV
jgi:seryl-tRNA synthetase